MFRGRDDWGCGPRGRRGGGGPWDWFGGGPGGPFGGGPFGPGGPQRGRMFGHGDLKFVVLNLLAEKPRHGYEIIRELEARFAGAYSPSPGTVYPTLSLLEDMGYARSTAEEGSSRKVYEITDEGRKYLEENRSLVDEIFDRVDEFSGFAFGPTMAALGGAFAGLGRAALRAAVRHQGDEQWAQRAREILERAARDIEGLN
ncbi:PadR family transcriptional regulator [Longimicrobium sp.]|uniref:PadR family transcriptional regulator n=1 Tax=Longimicrobium sp. TaxID=2029185 RepID=UPI002E310AD8|nr:PadR family transcriptional regulator [Longimicrobium sp.]HEX6038808.1 PadR family transcriptional regulator [Longimicrobium sp.]